MRTNYYAIVKLEESTQLSLPEIQVLILIRGFLVDHGREFFALNSYVVKVLDAHGYKIHPMTVSKAINRLAKLGYWEITSAAGKNRIVRLKPAIEGNNLSEMAKGGKRNGLGNLSEMAKHKNKDIKIKDINTPQPPKGGESEVLIKASEIKTGEDLTAYWEQVNKPFYKNRPAQIKAANELLERYNPSHPEDYCFLILAIDTLAVAGKKGFSHEYQMCPQIRTLRGLAKQGEVDRVFSFIYRQQQGELPVIS